MIALQHPLVYSEIRFVTLVTFYATVTFVSICSSMYVLTLYRYILAYRSIFCNDIYLLEVCSNEAAEGSVLRVVWPSRLGLQSLNEALQWCCVKIQQHTEKIILFFYPALNFFSFQLTNYAQLSMDFYCFSIPLSFIKMQAINSTRVSIHIHVLADSCVLYFFY